MMGKLGQVQMSDEPAGTEGQSSPSPGPVRALALAIFSITVLFGGYELLERLWLTDAFPMDVLHLFHVARGLLGATLVGAIFARSILREGGISAFDRAGEIQRQVDQLRNRDRLHRTYALWFVRMRWLAVCTAMLLAVLGTQVVPILGKDRLMPLAWAVLALAAGNYVFSLLGRRVERPLFHLRLQMAFDLLMLTVLLQQSGGIENPLFVAYSIHVVIAAILLPAGEAIVVATAASLLLGAVTVCELYGVVTHYEIGISPHGHIEEEVLHPAHDLAFAFGRAGPAIAAHYVVAGLVIMVVRELRRREEAILALADEARSSRLRLEAIMEASQAGIGLIDTSGKTVWANHRLLDWMRDAHEEEEEEVEDLVSLVRETTRQMQPLQIENTIHCPDRPTSHFLLSATPVVVPGEEVAQVVVVLNDVTDLKRMQALLVQAGKMAAIGETAGRIAHEVNNPAGIIAAKASILCESELPARVADEIRKIEGLALRIADIAKRMLDFARPATGARSKIDLNQVVQEAVKLVSGALARRAILVDAQLSPEKVVVMANSNELTQVLLNLLNNATDAMPTGGRIRVKVVSAAVNGKRQVVVRVSDTGPGFAKEVEKRVFEPFFTTKPPDKGTGLGLAISLTIVQEHGGRMEIENEPHGGAAVSVHLDEVEA